MKILVLLTALLISIQGYSDCKSEYAKAITIKATVSPLSTTGVVPAALLSNQILSSVDWGGWAPLFIAGGISAAGTSALFIAGVSNSVMAFSYHRALKLIKESEVAMGKNLSNVTENLSEEIGQDISEGEVADLVNDANENSLFCKEDLMFKHSDIYQYLLDIFKK